MSEKEIKVDKGFRQQVLRQIDVTRDRSILMDIAKLALETIGIVISIGDIQIRWNVLSLSFSEKES